MKLFIGVDSSLLKPSPPEILAYPKPVRVPHSVSSTGYMEIVRESLYPSLIQEREEENPVLFCDLKPMQIKKEEIRLEAQL